MSSVLKHKIFAFLYTYIAYMAIAAYRTQWSTSKKKIELNKSMDKEVLGNCDTIFLLFYGIGNLVLGKKGDEMDLRKFLGLGMFVVLLTNLFIIFLGYTQTYEPILFYLCFVVNGLAQSTMWPGVLAVINNWYGNESKGLVMNIFGTCSNAEKDEDGLSLQKQETSQTNDQLVESPTLDDDQQQIQMKGIGFINALKIDGVIQYTLVYSCIKSAYYAMYFWLPYYLETKQNFPDKGSRILSLNEVVIVIGTISVGYLSDKIKARVFILFPMLLIASIILFILPFIPVKYNYLLYVAIPKAGFMILTPYNQFGSAIVSDISQIKELVGKVNSVSTIIAIIQGLGGIIAALSQQITARLFDQFFIFVAALLTISTILFIPLAWRDFKKRFLVKLSKE